jgi:HSP20 family protein
MNTTRYNNPWGFFDQLQRELHNPVTRGSDSESRDWAPAVDVRENDKTYTLLVDIPGINPKDIDVSMEKGMLAIKGNREKNEAVEGENYRRVERSYGSFARYFDLPDSVDADNIEAIANNGVLTVTIPKQEVATSRRIEVKH